MHQQLLVIMLPISRRLLVTAIVIVELILTLEIIFALVQRFKETIKHLFVITQLPQVQAVVAPLLLKLNLPVQVISIAVQDHVLLLHLAVQLILIRHVQGGMFTGLIHVIKIREYRNTVMATKRALVLLVCQIAQVVLITVIADAVEIQYTSTIHVATGRVYIDHVQAMKRVLVVPAY